MSLQLLAVYVAFAGTLMRSVMVKLHKAAPSNCPSCGLPFERRALGETICGCSR